MQGLVQGTLCRVSLSKRVIQRLFGSSDELCKCCILKRSEKFKAKALQYAGRRYRHQSAHGTWNMKVDLVRFVLKLIGNQHKLKARILVLGAKAEGVNGGWQVSSLLGGCPVGLRWVP